MAGVAGVAGPAADAVAALLPLHPLQGGHAAVTPHRPYNMVTLWYNYSHYIWSPHGAQGGAGVELLQGAEHVPVQVQVLNAGAAGPALEIMSRNL